MSLLVFYRTAPSSHQEEAVFLDPAIATPRKLFFVWFAHEAISLHFGFCLLSSCHHPIQLGEALSKLPVLSAGVAESKGKTELRGVGQVNEPLCSRSPHCRSRRCSLSRGWALLKLAHSFPQIEFAVNVHCMDDIKPYSGNLLFVSLFDNQLQNFRSKWYFSLWKP